MLYSSRVWPVSAAIAPSTPAFEAWVQIFSTPDNCQRWQQRRRAEFTQLSWTMALHAYLAVAVLALLTILQSSAQAATPYFPDLLPDKYPNKELWTKLGKEFLWDALVNTDIDFVDPKTGRSVAPTFVGAKPRTPAICGRTARIWMRFAFHDCGTWSAKNKTGGCNGSLRKELPSTQSFTNPATGETLKDVFDILGKNKARADFAFDPTRLENTGFATSVAFFFLWKFEAEKFGLEASWADIMTYGALLAVNVCGGPPMLFVPGRVDSDTADPPGQLPPPFATFDEIITAYRRMGLGDMDGTAVQAAHTTSCFTAGCLDSTPSRFDNAWARELLEFYTTGSKDIPLCQFVFPPPPLKIINCVSPFDLGFAENKETRGYLELMTSDIQSFPVLLARTLAAAGFFNYGGYLKGVNLCTPEGCPADQWAFFQIASSSWWRLTSLGLKPEWVGHQYATRDTRPLNTLVQGPAILGEALLPEPPTPKEVEATMAEWETASKGVEEALVMPFGDKPPAVQAHDEMPVGEKKPSTQEKKPLKKKTGKAKP